MPKKKIKTKRKLPKKSKESDKQSPASFPAPCPVPHAPWPATCATNCVKAASPDVATCGRSRHCHRHRQRCRRWLPATCVFVSYGAGSGRVAKVPAVMRHVLGLCQRAIKARVNRRGWQSKKARGVEVSSTCNVQRGNSMLKRAALTPPLKFMIFTRADTASRPNELLAFYLVGGVAGLYDGTLRLPPATSHLPPAGACFGYAFFMAAHQSQTKATPATWQSQPQLRPGQ